MLLPSPFFSESLLGFGVSSGKFKGYLRKFKEIDGNVWSLFCFLWVVSLLVLSSLAARLPSCQLAARLAMAQNLKWGERGRHIENTCAIEMSANFTETGISIGTPFGAGLNLRGTKGVPRKGVWTSVNMRVGTYKELNAKHTIKPVVTHDPYSLGAP